LCYTFQQGRTQGHSKTIQWDATTSHEANRADVVVLRLLESVRLGLLILLVSLGSAVAAPYAAMVMDARTGEILHSRNADTRLHPASLTKMMTLYVVFDAVKRGEITLDTKIKISRKAAAEQPSKLGLKAGQRIALRYLIRAAAVKSANDAATALGEAISGSEAAFARRMTRMAKSLGMNKTTFKNAHGLTEKGHLSTARDMTVLGRHLIYDYPQYYNLFSRQTTHAGVKQVRNTNRRLLAAYKGADGIKTGYTRAAGFNLVASAERGRERVIATVFGGQSTASRNARVAELLDMGFKRAPSNVKTIRPVAPQVLAKIEPKIIKVKPTVTAVRRSVRPLQRPGPSAPEPTAEMLMAIVKDVETKLADPAPAVVVEVKPETKPEVDAIKIVEAIIKPSKSKRPTVTPIQRPKNLIVAALVPEDLKPKPKAREVITRASTSGGRHWGITLGRHTTRHDAERKLLQTALQEIETLHEALRKVVNHPRGWEANFVGLTKERAELACARLQARKVECETRGPGA
jgi:D-alanyl-D-alanine carboxypeptidase